MSLNVAWRAGSFRLRPDVVLTAAQMLMAVTVALAGLVTTALPFILAVQVAFGLTDLSIWAVVAILLPIAAAWAAFGAAAWIYRRVRGR